MTTNPTKLRGPRTSRTSQLLCDSSNFVPNGVYIVTVTPIVPHDFNKNPADCRLFPKGRDKTQSQTLVWVFRFTRKEQFREKRGKKKEEESLFLKPLASDLTSGVVLLIIVMLS